jgi:hypothetical protein
MPKALRELDIDEAKEIFERNMDLMNLHTHIRPKIEKTVDNKGKLDVEKFTEFCHRNAFLSIARDMGKFLEGFESNKYVSK